MGFHWKIELTANEIMILKQCAEYSKAMKKLPKKLREDKSTEREIYTNTINSAARIVRQFATNAKSLKSDGLVDSESGEWFITEKGSMVLRMIEIDASKISPQQEPKP